MKFDYTDNMVTGIIDIIRGEKLGSGSSRMVYDFLPDENLVIKLESDYSFQNIIEWELWDRIKFTKHSEWFAPCHYISSNGKVLIQSKTLPVRLEELPKKIPVFFH